MIIIGSPKAFSSGSLVNDTGHGYTLGYASCFMYHCLHVSLFHELHKLFRGTGKNRS